MEGLSEILSHFESLIARPGTSDEKGAAVLRQTLADHLLNAAKARAASPDTDEGQDKEKKILLPVFELVNFGYLHKVLDVQPRKRYFEPPLTQATKDMFRQKLNATLAFLMNRAGYENIPFSVVAHIRDKIDSERTLDIHDTVLSPSSKLSDAMQRAWKTLDKIVVKVASRHFLVS